MVEWGEGMDTRGVWLMVGWKKREGGGGWGMWVLLWWLIVEIFHGD